MQCSDALVRSVSGADKLNAKGQCLQRQWSAKERYERNVLIVKQEVWWQRRPADMRAGAREQLLGTHGRLLLHEREGRRDASASHMEMRARDGWAEEKDDVCGCRVWQLEHVENQLCPKQAAPLLSSGFVSHASLTGSVSY